mmetsp:Transcript_13760/g.39144  ORF Transcript_13760/g.39144 Transcript_13760/m.39144 type:complete len:239 (-) Transcript_13760:75-791(-)
MAGGRVPGHPVQHRPLPGRGHGPAGAAGGHIGHRRGRRAAVRAVPGVRGRVLRPLPRPVDPRPPVRGGPPRGPGPPVGEGAVDAGGPRAAQQCGDAQGVPDVRRHGAQGGRLQHDLLPELQKRVVLRMPRRRRKWLHPLCVCAGIDRGTANAFVVGASVVSAGGCQPHDVLITRREIIRHRSTHRALARRPRPGPRARGTCTGIRQVKLPAAQINTSGDMCGAAPVLLDPVSSPDHVF